MLFPRNGAGCLALVVAATLALAAPGCRRDSASASAAAPDVAATAPSPSASTLSGATLPDTIGAIATSALMVWFGKSGCSSVRIAQDLVLTAAHCAVGYDGTEDRGAPFVKRGEQGYPLAIVEMGPFRPSEGKMSDWVIAKAEQPEAALAGHAIATLVDRDELRGALGAVGRRLDDRSVAVWTVTFPMRSPRIHPRAPIAGTGRFASRGYLKSDGAYRESVLLGVKQGVIYDDMLEVPPPRFDGGADWESLRGTPLYENYVRYHQNAPRLLYHSADYAPGSSGGGIFVEATGHLIGIIPFGASVVPRTQGYPGFGQLYRVDVICSESATLSKHPACRRLGSQ